MRRSLTWIKPRISRRAKSAGYLFLAIALVLIASAQSDPIDRIERTSSIPATVCPKLEDEARTTALLPSNRTEIKSAKSRKASFLRARSNPYSLKNNSIVVEGGEINSWVLRSRSGTYTSATPCLIGDGDQWFVGASGALDSRARIVAINSGLSESAVEIFTFDRSGAAGSRAITIPPVSQREIRIDSLAPGAEASAIRVLTRSGRVSVFLVDERSRGLRTLGGDFLASQTPATRLAIAGIPSRLPTRAKLDHRIEIVATGTRASVVDVELLSGGSRFTPVGLNAVTVQPGEVKRLALPDELGGRAVAVIITATEEIAAAVISSTSREFAFSTPSLAVDSYSFNAGGLEPILSFVATAIRVNIEIVSRNGGIRNELLTGSEIVNWRVPSNSRRVSISSAAPIQIAATWSSSDGFTSLPLNPGTERERSSTPTFDINALLNR